MGTASKIILSFILSTGFVFAGNRTTSQLQSLANLFINSLTSSSANTLSINSTGIIFNSDIVKIHQFELLPAGFLLISDNTDFPPIIGYSIKEHTGKDLPPQLKSILNQYIEDYSNEFIEQKQIVQNNELWDKIEKGSSTNLQNTFYPLLTTEWAQGKYYNEACPEDANSTAGNGKVWTGCVATALAQILKYHTHPLKGTGSKSYTSTNYGQLSADFGNTIYDWENMPAGLSSTSSNLQIDAVAELMYHCGVAVSMRYGPNESGASHSQVKSALQNYFQYSFFTELISRTTDNKDRWTDIIKNQLDQNFPVYYGIRDDSRKLEHAFVCDGYNNDNYFHCNWGWDGDYNGYYALGSLTPSDYNFDSGHLIIAGAEPVDKITESTTWSGNIEIKRSIEFTNSAKLNILPGSNVFFEKDKYVLVTDGFTAEGTLTDSIKFMPLGSYTWKGIIIQDNSGNGKNSLQYCSFINADGSNRVVQFDKYNSGGALQINTKNDVEIENCTFNSCNATKGGAIAIYGNSNSQVTFKMSENHIYKNVAKEGGGVFVENIDCMINSNMMHQNYSNKGGAVSVSGKDVNLNNNIFYNNNAGVGCSISASSVAELIFMNNTIINNIDSAGTLLNLLNIKKGLINNSIIWREGSVEGKFLISNLNSNLELKFSIVKNGKDVITNSNTINYKFNIEEDPQISISNIGYELPDSSPAVNNGDPDTSQFINTKDFYEYPRIFGDRIDIGAVENQQKFTTAQFELSKNTIRFNTLSTFTEIDTLEILNANNPDLTIQFSQVNYPFTAQINEDTSKIMVAVDRAIAGEYSSRIKIFTNINSKSIDVFAKVKKAYEGKISGILNEDTIRVTGNLAIEKNDSLQVKPGTTIIFYKPCQFDISGKLFSIGSFQQPIVFTYNSSGEPLININFLEDSRKSKIDNCKFIYPTTISRFGATGGIKLNITNTDSIVISNCEFNEDTYHELITLIESQGITFENNVFSGRYSSRNIFAYYSSLHVEGNRFINSGGVETNYSKLDFINNLLVNCEVKLLTIENSDHNYLNKIIGNSFINNWGQLYSVNFHSLFLNNTFANNYFVKYEQYSYWRYNTGEIFIGNNSKSNFINCVFYNPEAKIDDSTFVLIDSTSQVSFINCNIHGGLSTIEFEGSSLNNVIFLHPLFTDPRFISDENFNLLDKSYCIDVGKTEGIEEYITLTDLDGNPRIYNGKIDIGAHEFQGVISGIEEDQFPGHFELSQNYPNPFNPATTIEYSVPEMNNVQLIIYNVLGQQIATLVNEVQPPGNHEVEFNASTLASGLYFYELTSGSLKQTRKMLLLK